MMRYLWTVTAQLLVLIIFEIILYSFFLIFNALSLYIFSFSYLLFSS